MQGYNKLKNGTKIFMMMKKKSFCNNQDSDKRMDQLKSLKKTKWNLSINNQSSSLILSDSSLMTYIKMKTLKGFYL